MKNIVLSFISILSFTFFLNAQNLSDPIPTDKDVRIGVLDNGLKYYIKHNGYPEDKVELRLGINAGSVLETDEQQGLAHFMEHMNFNGTKNFPKNKLVDFLQSIGVEFGADLNAYTSFDRTVYMLPIPLDKPGNLDNGLTVIEDWAFNALLTDEDINDERGVILEELRLRQGADNRMMQKWLPIAFKDSRYAERLPIGKEEILKTFDTNTLRQFHTDWYRPNLMTVVVVGDIDVDEIEQKIKTNFGKYKNPANPKERPNFSVPNYTSPNVGIASDKEASFPNARIVYFAKEDAKSMVTIGDYRDELKNRLFAQMLNDRYQELANSDNPPFNYAYSYYGSTISKNKNGFTSFVSAGPEKLNSAFQTVLNENQRVKQFGFIDSELDRAKANMMSSIEKQYNNRDKIESKNWVNQYLNNYLDAEPIPSMEWEYQAYQQLLPTIKIDEVNSLIDKFIQEENYSVIVTSPEETLTVADVNNAITTSKNAKLDAYTDDSAGLVLMADKPKPGKIAKTSTDKTMNTTTLELKNGVKVVYKKTDYKNDEIVFSASSYGGYSLVDDDTWRKVHFAMDGVSEAGVNGLSQTELDKVLAGKSVRVSPYVSNLSEGMSGNSTNKDLETMFQLINLNFTKMNYNEKAFESFKQKQQGMYGTLLNNPEFFFYNQFNKFSNQNNPRNGNIVPLDEDWAVADYKLAYDVYKQRFANPADFTFYFVGSIDEEQLKDLAATYLGSLTTNKTRENYKEVAIPPMTGLNEEIIKKGTETKAMVNMNYMHRTPYNKKDAMSMKMIGEALGIKMTETLREKEGGVYSTRANGYMSRGINSAAGISITIPTGVDQYQKMRDLTVQELNTIIANGPTPEDLNKVKEGLIEDYKDNIQTNKYWLNLLTQSAFYNEDPSEALKYESFVKSFTVADLKDAANRLIGQDQIVGILIPEVDAPSNVDVESNDNTTVLPPLKDVTAINVINRYLEVISGESDVNKAKSKLQAAKKIMITGKFDLGGIQVPGNMNYFAPNSVEMMMDLSAMGQGKMTTKISQDQTVIEMGGQSQTGPGEESLKYQKGVFPQAFYTSDDIALKDNDTVNGKDCYVIENKNSKEFQYYNIQTGLLEKSADESEQVFYKNYQLADNILIPFIYDIKGDQPMKFLADEIAVE